MTIQFKEEEIQHIGSLLFDLEKKVFIRSYDSPARSVEEEACFLKNSTVYVAYINQKPIGFFAYEIENKEVELKIIAVIPEFQRKRIGSQMISKILSMIEGRLIKLGVHPSNKTAIIFYLKHGFQISEWRDNYYGDGQPRLLLKYMGKEAK